MSQPSDLCLEGVKRYRVSCAQGVAEHAGFEAEALEPLDHRLALVCCMLRVSATGQHDHVCHDVGHRGPGEGLWLFSDDGRLGCGVMIKA